MSSGVPDLKKIDPILFSMFENRYFSVGGPAGRAWHDGANYADKHGLPKPEGRGH
jgi:hypothetical protein